MVIKNSLLNCDILKQNRKVYVVKMSHYSAYWFCHTFANAWKRIFSKSIALVTYTKHVINIWKKCSVFGVDLKQFWRKRKKSVFQSSVDRQKTYKMSQMYFIPQKISKKLAKIHIISIISMNITRFRAKRIKSA